MHNYVLPSLSSNSASKQSNIITAGAFLTLNKTLELNFKRPLSSSTRSSLSELDSKSTNSQNLAQDDTKDSQQKEQKRKQKNKARKARTDEDKEFKDGMLTISSQLEPTRSHIDALLFNTTSTSMASLK